METRKITGKGLLQVYIPIEDLVWIDQQIQNKVASSRAAIVSKLVNEAILSNVK